MTNLTINNRNKSAVTFCAITDKGVTSYFCLLRSQYKAIKREGKVTIANIGKSDYRCSYRGNLLGKPQAEVIVFSDGFKFTKVSYEYAVANWNKEQIYGIRVDEESEALIQCEDDLKAFDTFGTETKTN